MEDYFDGYDDFDEAEFIDGEQFDESLEEDFETNEQYADDIEPEDEPDPSESKDREFTASDAFLVGSFAGWAYKEGLKERKRRKHKKVSGD